MSNIKLVLLGVLCQKPMHGYEIKHIIEDHMGDWTDIKFGSIYFALSKLAEEQAVEVAEEGRDGNRPSRTVYRITDRGRQEYLLLLRELWSSQDRTLYGFDIGLFFINSLPKEEVALYLQQRIKRADESLSYLRQHGEQMQGSPHIPAQARAIVSHTLAHTVAERNWLIEVKEQLDDFY
jgi:DNA-binding PadR family transcriptional regulator